MDSNFTKRDLTLEELSMLEMEMLKKRKTKEAAWGLWIGLSFFGAHRFYTENYGYASAMFLTSFIPIVAIISIIFFTDILDSSLFLFYICLFLLFGSVIWSWIDAIFLNKRIEQLNDSIEYEIINNIKLQRRKI